MNDKIAVVPEYYPVLSVDISRLDEAISVPESLKRFWLEHGTSFFNRDENGDLVNVDAQNILLPPDLILEILENADDEDLEIYQNGLPFFERYDACYFLVNVEGKVVDEHLGEITVIADSIDDFVTKLTEDSSFYEALL